MNLGINREPFVCVNQEFHRKKRRFTEKTHYSTENIDIVQ